MGQNGGARPGAGRKPGSAWRPAVGAMRAETIQKMRSIVGSDRDPLSCIVDIVTDETRDIGIRLQAAHICLPFLYPRLTASQIDARVVTVKAEPGELLQRLEARLAKLAPPAPPIEIEATPVPAKVAAE